MKKKLLHCFNKSRRFLALITAMLVFSLQLVAAPEDHGRWYSVDDSGSSSHSAAFYVFCFIIGAICAGFLLITTLNDNKHSNSDKGCITVFLLGLLAIGFFCVMKACS